MSERLLDEIKYALEGIQKQSEWFNDNTTAGKLIEELSEIKYAIDNVQKQSEWFNDRSTAGKVVAELAKVNENLTLVNSNLEAMQESLTAIWRRLSWFFWWGVGSEDHAD